MSNDPNTAADLFADDIMRIVMSRLQVRLQPDGSKVEVLLVDTRTGYAFQCAGPKLEIVLPRQELVLTTGY